MIQTKAIDHVCLWVRSLAESRRYYERLFGFSCRPRAGDDSTLLVESAEVHFFLSEADSDNDFISKQHLSFEVASIEAVMATLREQGITEFEVGTVDLFAQRNYHWCEWRDPNGIRLECVQVIK